MNLIDKQSGLSLLEILITLVFIAVIAMMAIPVYQNNLEISQRNDAKAAMNKVVNQLEQYYLKHKEYTGDMKIIGFKNDPIISEKGFYSIDAVVLGKDHYVVKAVPIDEKDNSECGYLIVDSKGKRDSQRGENCW